MSNNPDSIMIMRDICNLLNRSARAVRNLRNTYADFPIPIHPGMPRNIWAKADIMAWYETHREELAIHKQKHTPKKYRWQLAGEQQEQEEMKNVD
ncbi:TPA: hypothetical protein LAM73_004571 [Escherichia coli]|nr:hypothetical protein [Escherichia coli]